MLVDYLLCVKRAGGRELEVELELLKAALEIAKARSNTEVEVGTLKAGTWRVGRHLEVEVATLKGQLDTTTLQLKFTTTDYLRVQVLLDMRGVMGEEAGVEGPYPAPLQRSLLRSSTRSHPPSALSHSAMAQWINLQVPSKGIVGHVPGVLTGQPLPLDAKHHKDRGFGGRVLCCPCRPARAVWSVCHLLKA